MAHHMHTNTEIHSVSVQVFLGKMQIMLAAIGAKPQGCILNTEPPYDYILRGVLSGTSCTRGR